jgi:hypothetical protein
MAHCLLFPVDFPPMTDFEDLILVAARSSKDDPIVTTPQPQTTSWFAFHSRDIALR